MGLNYSDLVDYSTLDPVKRMALELFEPTLSYPERLGIRILPETLGEPAVGYDTSGVSSKDFITFSNIEAVGTKQLVADAMFREIFVEKKRTAEKIGIRHLYGGLGQDAVAMSTNDCLSMGADAFLYLDAIASGDSRYFGGYAGQDRGFFLERAREILMGYRRAADAIRLAIPQGETSAHGGVIDPSTIDLTGSSTGLVLHRKNLITGQRQCAGDVIVGIESSGIHANGLTLARKIAESLPDDYFTDIGNGKTLGEELLTPTTLYTRPVIEMLERGVDAHYMQPITGHGFEKIARSRYPFRYRIDELPEIPLIFQKLAEFGSSNGFDMSRRQLYRTFNMGVGWVIIAPRSSVRTIEDVARKHGLGSYEMGVVEKGPRSVILPFKDDEGRHFAYAVK